MSIQDLGSIGELVAAIATVATLVYLAIQVRHNTRALKASTFENVSSEMGQNVVPILMTSDLADIYARVLQDPDSLSAGERVRISAMYVSSFRKLESVFVQTQLGSIDAEYAEGFERSLISLGKTPFGEQWWASAKQLFYKHFVAHADARLADDDIPEGNPAVTPE